MGKLEHLAEKISRSLKAAVPGIRKTILKKLPDAVAAMMEARTPNTMELSTLLPLACEKADMREQWLRRLLTNPLIESTQLLGPFAQQALLFEYIEVDYNRNRLHSILGYVSPEEFELSKAA